MHVPFSAVSLAMYKITVAAKSMLAETRLVKDIKTGGFVSERVHVFRPYIPQRSNRNCRNLKCSVGDDIRMM